MTVPPELSESKTETVRQSPIALPPGFFPFTWAERGNERETSAPTILRRRANLDSLGIAPRHSEGRTIIQFSGAEIIISDAVIGVKPHEVYKHNNVSLLLGKSEHIPLNDVAIKIFRESGEIGIKIVFPKDPLLETGVRVIKLLKTKPPQELPQSEIDEQEIRTAQILHYRRTLRFAQSRPSMLAARQFFKT